MSCKDPVDDEDRRLFRQAVAGAEPLEYDGIERARPRPPPRPQQTRADEARVLTELLADPPDWAELETGDELWFARTGVGHRTLRKLRRGRFSVAAALDLHGMTVEEARETLVQFLGWAAQQRSRCVRIIHGKGHGSRNGPVLKRKVFHWLCQRDEVLAVCSAQRVHGGTGAVYVLLQRKN